MKVRYTKLSQQDLLGIANYLIDNADKGVADKVVDEIKRVIVEVLSANPNIGTGSKASIKDLLFFPAGKYPRYQIYYRLIDGTLEVYRVLHGKRDVTNILDES